MAEQGMEPRPHAAARRAPSLWAFPSGNRSRRHSVQTTFSREDLHETVHASSHYVGVYPDALVANMKRLCLLPAQSLSRKLRLERVAYMASNPSPKAAFLSSRPITISFNIWWVRAICLSCVLLVTVVNIQTAILMTSVSLPYKRFYKFTNLQARDGIPPSAPGVREFGLLVRESGGLSESCLASRYGEGPPLVAEGASLILPTPDYGCEDGCSNLKEWRQEFTGWFLVTSESNTTAGDPVRFILEGSDDMVSWEVLDLRKRFDTPAGRGEIVALYTAVTWFQVADLTIWLIFVVTWSIMVFLGQVNLARHVARAIVIGYVLMATVALVAGLERASGLEWGEAIYFWVMSFDFLLVAHWAGYSEKYFDIEIMLTAAILLLDQLFLIVYVDEAQEWFSVTSLRGLMNIKICGSMLGTFNSGSLFLVLRFMQLFKSMRTVDKDKRVYQDVWETFIAENKDAVSRLERLVYKMQKRTGKHAARQYNRKGRSASSMPVKTTPMSWVTHNHAPQSPSLDGRRSSVGSESVAEGTWRNNLAERVRQSRNRSAHNSVASDYDGSSRVFGLAGSPHHGSLLSPPQPSSPPTQHSPPERSPSPDSPLPQPPQPSSPPKQQHSPPERSPSPDSPLPQPQQPSSPPKQPDSPSERSRSRSRPGAHSPPVEGDGRQRGRHSPASPGAHSPPVQEPRQRGEGLRESAGTQGSSEGARPRAEGEAVSPLNGVAAGRRGGGQDGTRGIHVTKSGQWQRSHSVVLQAEASKQILADLVSPSADNLSIHGRSGTNSREGPLALSSQHNPAAVDPRFHIKRLESLRVDMHSPCTNLDQLYAQACLLEGFLLAKVIDLSVRCNGKFKRSTSKPAPRSAHRRVSDAHRAFRAVGNLAGSLKASFKSLRQGSITGSLWGSTVVPEPARPEYTAWSDELSRDDLDLPGTKSVPRCVSKADSAFGGDPSYLMDICRNCLYFDTVQDLHTCLVLLQDDPTVHIVRVKSTMSKRFNQNRSFAGYRFVSVNFTIRDESTAYLCVETHVCELLLVLRCFAEVQTPAMHARYAEWRLNKASWAAVLFRDNSFRAMMGRDRPPEALEGIQIRRSSLASSFEAESSLAPSEGVFMQGEGVRLHAGWAHWGSVGNVARGENDRPQRLLPEEESGRSGSPPTHGANGTPHGVNGAGEVSVSGAGFGSDPVALPEPGGAEGAELEDKGRRGDGEVIAIDEGRGAAATAEGGKGAEAAPVLSENAAADDGAQDTANQPEAESWSPHERFTSSRSGSSKRAVVRKQSLLSMSGSGVHPEQRSPEISSMLGLGAQTPSMLLGGLAAPLSPTPSSTWRQRMGFSAPVTPLAMAMAVEIPEEARTTTYGLQLSSPMVATLEAYSRIAALGLGNLLDNNFRHRFSLGLEDASARSVFFTSRPVTAGSVKRVIQVLALCFGVLWIWNAATFVQQALQPLPPYQHYRFRNMNWSNGTKARTPGIQSFGLLEPTGCSPMHSLARKSDGEGPFEAPQLMRSQAYGESMYVTYSEPTSPRGWYIFVDPALEGTKFFEIEGANADIPPLATPAERSAALQSAEWVWLFAPVQAEQYEPSWRPSSLVAERWPDAFELPEVHGVRAFIFEASPSGMHLVGRSLFFLKGVSSVLYAVLGALRRPILARNALIIVWGLGVVAALFSMGDYMVKYHTHEATELALHTVPEILCVAAFIFERRFFPFLAAASISDICLRAVLVYLDGSDAASGVSIFGIILAGLLSLLVLLRYLALRDSRKMMRGDQAQYDALWEEEVKRDESAGCIAHLEKVVSMLGILPTDSCRQYNRMQAGKLPNFHRMSAATRIQPPNALFDSIGGAYLPVPGTIDPKNMTNSIDQLYAQASVSNVLLCDLIKKWAEPSNGSFPLASDLQHSNAYVNWREAQSDQRLVNRIKWTTLKKHRRAIEKLLRVYEGDVSRLVDLARTCIIFETVSDLTLCLGQIVTDESVVIERVKNRLSLSYVSSETAGYRDVAINFRIVCPESIAVGSETHVCEVQLVLASFYKLKSNQGHARYVAFRNVRGT